MGYLNALRRQQQELDVDLAAFEDTVAANQALLKGMRPTERQAVLRMFKQLDALHIKSRDMVVDISNAEIAKQRARAERAELALRRAGEEGATRSDTAAVQRLEAELAKAHAELPTIVAAVTESVAAHVAELEDALATESATHAAQLASLTEAAEIARAAVARSGADEDALRARLAGVETELGDAEVARAAALVEAAASPADRSSAAGRIAELELRCAQSQSALRAAVRDVDGAVADELRALRGELDDSRTGSAAMRAREQAATSEVELLRARIATQAAAAEAVAVKDSALAVKRAESLAATQEGALVRVAAASQGGARSIEQVAGCCRWRSRCHWWDR